MHVIAFLVDREGKDRLPLGPAHVVSSSSVQLLQRAEDAVGAGVHPDRGDVAPPDHTVRVDNEERPLARPGDVAVDAVGACDVALRLEIGEQREVQVAILGEGQVAPGAVHRDRDEFGSELLELGEHRLVQTQLVGADGAPVLGVEHQDHGLSPEVGEHDLLIRRREQLEIRGAIPRRKRGGVACDVCLAHDPSA